MYFRDLDAAIAGYQRVNDVTQAELAEAIGLTEQTFSLKRRGKNADFSLSEFISLCEVIGVDVYDSVLH